MDYCKVTEQGVAHLFLELDYGRVCVCGRKMFGFSMEGEEPALHDVALEVTSPLLSLAYARHKALATPQVWRADLLLFRGEHEIQRARQARASMGITGTRGSLVRAQSLLGRGQRVVQSARQIRTEATALVEQRRFPPAARFERLWIQVGDAIQSSRELRSGLLRRREASFG